MNLVSRMISRFKTVPRAETTTLRSPATWLFDALFGQRGTAAGVDVSDSTALSLSAYFCGINMIAGTIGSLPLNVYKSSGKTREVWSQHPAHYLLHTEPNPEMTSMSMRQTMVFHAIHKGNAYAEILWDVRGNAKELWLIPPDICRPRRDEEGVLWYEVSLPSGEKRYLKPENILHIPGLGYDGICGYGLMQLARESIGLNSAQEQYAAKFFRNGGNISGTIETPNILNDKQFGRLKSEVAAKLQGLSNAHRIAILENGMKFTPMNPTHADAQLVEERRFTIEEWARWLNMPPHKLREMTHATFSNIEHQNIEWVVDTIRPWLIRFEQEYNRKLFRKQSVFYTKHTVEGLLRGDLASRYAAYAIARQWGWMSADDVLELEDRNPLPDNQGKIYLVPMNMIPADMVGKEKDPVEQVEPTEFVKAAAERVVRFETNTLKSLGPSAYNSVAVKVAEWMFVSKSVASEYCKMAANLNIIADENEITQDELKARKAAMLVQLSNRENYVKVS